jgi:hypothetical protein
LTIHGKDAYFSLEDSAGSTLRNLSSQLTNITFGRSNDQHDTTTFGQEGHTWIAGLTQGTINLDGFWDKTASTGSATVLDSLVGLDTLTLGFEYGPEGNTNGNVKYSGECILNTVDYATPVADLVTFTATLAISGTVTVGTFSA